MTLFKNPHSPEALKLKKELEKPTMAETYLNICSTISLFGKTLVSETKKEFSK